MKQLKKLGKSDRRHLEKVYELIIDIEAHPFSGIGKPERLKYFDDNRWSRRIDQKNRLVYTVLDPDIVVISVIGHY